MERPFAIIYIYWAILNYAMSHYEPICATMSHYEPLGATMSHYDPKYRHYDPL